jgi:hypothetical protein
MTELGLALERRLYIEKLRTIGKYIEHNQEEEDPELFKMIEKIMTEENKEFKLIK